METQRGTAWTGWIVFAGILMMIVSALNIFEGLLLLIADERVAATADGLVIVDMTAWGWTLVLSGIVLLVVGIGLLAGAGWARMTAIVVIGLHAATQVLWLGAYPVWSLLMIALDIVVLFALCTQWSSVRYDLRAHEGRNNPADAVRDQALSYRHPM